MTDLIYFFCTIYLQCNVTLGRTMYKVSLSDFATVLEWVFITTLEADISFENWRCIDELVNDKNKITKLILWEVSYKRKQVIL